jgi:4'-phosphopantetheinyl transferase
MPLVLKERLTDTNVLAVWKIEESPERFLEHLTLDDAEESYYSTLRSEVRKRHWLSYRVALNDIFEGVAYELYYDEYGKPWLKNGHGYISVSHSGEYSAVITGAGPVGLDIEKVRERILRISDRFLSAEELAGIGTVPEIEKYYVYWGAKESLYKIHGKPGIDLCHDILIEPFDYLCSGIGSCRAVLKSSGNVIPYDLFYRKIEDYILVYTY